MGYPEEVLEKIRLEEPLGVQWQNQILARAQLKNDVYLVSEFEDSRVKEMMMVPVPTIEEGLQKALRVLGDNAEVAIMSQGPLVLPIIED